MNLSVATNGKCIEVRGEGVTNPDSMSILSVPQEHLGPSETVKSPQEL